MGDDRYYRDAPSFERRDPLRTWAFVFAVASAVALVWVLVLFWLMATRRLAAPANQALGLSQTAWVIIATAVLFGCLIGLIFIVLARVGRTQGGTYIDATARSEDEEAGPPRARVRAKAQGTLAGTVGGGSALQIAAVREAARIEAATGPDGRMLLSYTVPVEQPRGLYADTYVAVDADAVLNVKTLLAKTPGAR